jgi:hypothetical protein
LVMQILKKIIENNTTTTALFFEYFTNRFETSNIK